MASMPIELQTTKEVLILEVWGLHEDENGYAICYEQPGQIRVHKKSMFTILSAYCKENALHVSLNGVHSSLGWQVKLSIPMLQSLIKPMYHSAHFSQFF
jgi:hypothetical protein